MQIRKEFLPGFMMNRQRGSGIIVKAHPETLETFLVHLMKSIDDLLWLNAVLLGPNSDRNPVLVRAANVDDVASFQTLVADIYISWQIGSCKVTDVQGTVCVG